MTNLKISIITTCFDSDKTIAYTLSSVHNQTYKNVEHAWKQKNGELAISAQNEYQE